MLSSPVIDLAIGLTFVFGVTAALASLLTEFVARFLGLRGAYLLSGLRELVDGGGSSTNLTNVTQDYQAMRGMMLGPKPATKPTMLPSVAPPQGAPSAQPWEASLTAALLGGPILGNQGVAGQLSDRKLTLGEPRVPGGVPKITASGPTRLRPQLRSLPAYISSRSFADAVIDLVLPNADGQTTMTAIQENIDKLPDTIPFKTSLQALVKNANGDVTKFRTSVEQWYDDHMDRVSGWYKRSAAKITLVVGAIVIVLLNLNALTVGRTLYTENAVSSAVSTAAVKASDCTSATQTCLATLDGDLSAAASSGLPVGWGTVRACREKGAPCGFWERRGILSPYGSDAQQAAQVLLVLLGFLIMIVALLPGAQFWFGLLSKLGTLRSTGPKPAAATSTAINLTVSPPAASPVASAAPDPPS